MEQVAFDIWLNIGIRVGEADVKLWIDQLNCFDLCLICNDLYGGRFTLTDFKMCVIIDMVKRLL